MKWPDPNATREEIDAYRGQNEPIVDEEGIPHEAPEVENGPSLVCNACGIVRVSMLTPFCKGCMAMMEGM